MPEEAGPTLVIRQCGLCWAYAEQTDIKCATCGMSFEIILEGPVVVLAVRHPKFAGYISNLSARELDVYDGKGLL